MTRKTFTWICTLALMVIASCSKCKYDYIQRTPLSFSKVMDMGIEGCMEYYMVPGCAWVVINEQDIIFGKSGEIIRGSLNSIETTHRFQIGSLGKSYTALMAAKCVEDGLLNWDTKLFSVFPEWKNKAHIAYHEITLSDLLSHNTPLRPLNTHKTHIDKKTRKPVYENIPNFSGTDFERRRKFCQYALSLSPVGVTGVNYGNAGYVIAGSMLEKVAGKTWEELALNLAIELNMSIGFERPNRLDPFQPWGHYSAKNNCLMPVPPEELRIYNDPLFSPAGNINVSIIDFSKYLRQFMHGLNNMHGVVAPESIKYLLTGNEPYAMGWYNSNESDSIFYHYGSEGTFYCHMMIFANINSAIIIFTNASLGDNSVNFINDARNYLKQKHIYNDLAN